MIGCGAVGLNAMQAAALEQAATVIAIDRDPAKLALARALRRHRTLVAADDATIERSRR